MSYLHSNNKKWTLFSVSVYNNSLNDFDALQYLLQVVYYDILKPLL